MAEQKPLAEQRDDKPLTPEGKRDKAAVEAATRDASPMIREGEEKGFIGEVPDPTPNEHYTVAGVTSGKPTPETDDDQAFEARKRVLRVPLGRG